MQKKGANHEENACVIMISLPVLDVNMIFALSLFFFPADLPRQPHSTDAHKRAKQHKAQNCGKNNFAHFVTSSISISTRGRALST